MGIEPTKSPADYYLELNKYMTNKLPMVQSPVIANSSLYTTLYCGVFGFQPPIGVIKQTVIHVIKHTQNNTVANNSFVSFFITNCV